MLPEQVSTRVDLREPRLERDAVAQLQIFVSGEHVATVGRLVHRVGERAEVRAGLAEAVKEAVQPSVEGLLPPDVAGRVELEQQRARAALVGRRGSVPVAGGQVAAVRGLDDRERPGAGGRRAGAEAVEAPRPHDVAAGVELDHECAARRSLELAGRHVPAVGGRLHITQQHLVRSRRPEPPLPLHVAVAVELEDQAAYVLVGVVDGARGDEATVARALELVDRAPTGAGVVNPRPHRAAGRAHLLYQRALSPTGRRTVATRPATDRAAADDVASIGGLHDRHAVGVVARRRAEASQVPLPLRCAGAVHLHQPADPRVRR